jgi:hypothetical protein
MLTVALITWTLLQTAGPANLPREWTDGDPEVRFVEGTTSPPIYPIDRLRGPAEIDVRCVVGATGYLERCAVVREAPRRVLSHRSARSAVQKMQLLLREGGPAPGDGFTIAIVVTSN